MPSNVRIMNHPNLVVVHYNQYAGGKFFVNCLAHNNNVLPGITIASPEPYDSWALGNLPNREKIRCKIKRINQTIPNNLLEWTQHELGCINFWGAFYYQLVDDHEPVNTIAVDLLKGHTCFLISHLMSKVTESVTKMPRARHIFLHNARNFQELSAKIKCPYYDDPEFKLLFEDPPEIPGAFYLDVDATYFDTKKTISEVERCIRWLGRPVELDANLPDYITRYWEIHRSQ